MFTTSAQADTPASNAFRSRRTSPPKAGGSSGARASPGNLSDCFFANFSSPKSALMRAPETACSRIARVSPSADSNPDGRQSRSARSDASVASHGRSRRPSRDGGGAAACASSARKTHYYNLTYLLTHFESCKLIL